MLQIFAEGDDIKFIEDYITYLGFPKNQLFSNKTEGWTKLKNLSSKFYEASNKDVPNLVIFDADENFEVRKNEILEIQNQLNLKFDLFLFPNKHR